MDNNTKYLLLAGVAGVGLWWWWNNSQANAQIVAHTPTTPIALPAGVTAGSSQPADQVTPPNPFSNGSGAVVVPAAQTTVSGSAMVAALIQWSNQTKNPALYQQMINQLSASDLAGLYNILTTVWAGTAAITPAQTAFWNNLRSEYPMLNTGGMKADGTLCTNLQCTP